MAFVGYGLFSRRSQHEFLACRGPDARCGPRADEDVIDGTEMSSLRLKNEYQLVTMSSIIDILLLKTVKQEKVSPGEK
jgi:hypothetical protein